MTKGEKKGGDATPFYLCLLIIKINVFYLSASVVKKGHRMIVRDSSPRLRETRNDKIENNLRASVVKKGAYRNAL